MQQYEPDLLNKTNTSPCRWLVTHNMLLLILIRALFSPHKRAINLSLLIIHSVFMNEKKSKPLADYFLLSEKNQINKIFFRPIKKKKKLLKKKINSEILFLNCNLKLIFFGNSSAEQLHYISINVVCWYFGTFNFHNCISLVK